MDQRVCRKCHVEKPATVEFFDAQNGRLSHRCKECRRKYSHEYNLAHKEQNREFQRKWRAEHKEELRPYHQAYLKRHPEVPRNWEKRNPEKVRAQKRLHSAVTYGRVIKPSHCDNCRKEIPAAKLHAHHDDYSRPLDVKWLCAPCHKIIHRKEGTPLIKM